MKQVIDALEGVENLLEDPLLTRVRTKAEILKEENDHKLKHCSVKVSKLNKALVDQYLTEEDVDLYGLLVESDTEQDMEVDKDKTVKTVTKKPDKSKSATRNKRESTQQDNKMKDTLNALQIAIQNSKQRSKFNKNLALEKGQNKSTRHSAVEANAFKTDSEKAHISALSKTPIVTSTVAVSSTLTSVSQSSIVCQPSTLADGNYIVLSSCHLENSVETKRQSVSVKGGTAEFVNTNTPKDSNQRTTETIKGSPSVTSVKTNSSKDVDVQSSDNHFETSVNIVKGNLPEVNKGDLTEAKTTRTEDKNKQPVLDKSGSEVALASLAVGSLKSIVPDVPNVIFKRYPLLLVPKIDDIAKAANVTGEIKATIDGTKSAEKRNSVEIEDSNAKINSEKCVTVDDVKKPAEKATVEVEKSTDGKSTAEILDLDKKITNTNSKYKICSKATSQEGSIKIKDGRDTLGNLCDGESDTREHAVSKKTDASVGIDISESETKVNGEIGTYISKCKLEKDIDIIENPENVPKFCEKKDLDNRAVEAVLEKRTTLEDKPTSNKTNLVNKMSESVLKNERNEKKDTVDHSGLKSESKDGKCVPRKHESEMKEDDTGVSNEKCFGFVSLINEGDGDFDESNDWHEDDTDDVAIEEKGGEQLDASHIVALHGDTKLDKKDRNKSNNSFQSTALNVDTTIQTDEENDPVAVEKSSAFDAAIQELKKLESGFSDKLSELEATTLTKTRTSNMKDVETGKESYHVNREMSECSGIAKAESEDIDADSSVFDEALKDLTRLGAMSGTNLEVLPQEKNLEKVDPVNQRNSEKLLETVSLKIKSEKVTEHSVLEENSITEKDSLNITEKNEEKEEKKNIVIGKEETKSENVGPSIVVFMQPLRKLKPDAFKSEMKLDKAISRNDTTKENVVNEVVTGVVLKSQQEKSNELQNSIKNAFCLKKPPDEVKEEKKVKVKKEMEMMVDGELIKIEEASSEAESENEENEKTESGKKELLSEAVSMLDNYFEQVKKEAMGQDVLYKKCMHNTSYHHSQDIQQKESTENKISEGTKNIALKALASLRFKRVVSEHKPIDLPSTRGIFSMSAAGFSGIDRGATFFTGTSTSQTHVPPVTCLAGTPRVLTSQSKSFGTNTTSSTAQIQTSLSAPIQTVRVKPILVPCTGPGEQGQARILYVPLDQNFLPVNQALSPIKSPSQITNKVVKQNPTNMFQPAFPSGRNQDVKILMVPPTLNTTVVKSNTTSPTTKNVDASSGIQIGTTFAISGFTGNVNSRIPGSAPIVISSPSHVSKPSTTTMSTVVSRGIHAVMTSILPQQPSNPKVIATALERGNAAKAFSSTSNTPTVITIPLANTRVLPVKDPTKTYCVMSNTPRVIAIPLTNTRGKLPEEFPSTGSLYTAPIPHPTLAPVRSLLPKQTVQPHIMPNVRQQLVKKVTVVKNADGSQCCKETGQPYKYPEGGVFLIAGPRGLFYNKETGNVVPLPEKIMNSLKHKPGAMYYVKAPEILALIKKKKKREYDKSKPRASRASVDNQPHRPRGRPRKNESGRPPKKKDFSSEESESGSDFQVSDSGNSDNAADDDEDLFESFQEKTVSKKNTKQV